MGKQPFAAKSKLQMGPFHKQFYNWVIFLYSLLAEWSASATWGYLYVFLLPKLEFLGTLKANNSLVGQTLSWKWAKTACIQSILQVSYQLF